MATVYLTSTVPAGGGGSFHRLKELARADRFGVHTLTEDPEVADVLLFAETAWGNELLWRARWHPLVRRHREKAFVQCELDGVVPFLPGIYTSVPRRWYRADRVRTGPYTVMYANPAVRHAPDETPRYLFSFVGDSRTHDVRRRVLALRHPEAFLDDTAERSSARAGGPDAVAAFQERYSALLRDSAFVLCPAGRSPSTVRLFEVMKTGRVPVVIADEWVPPAGPAWNTFWVRVHESEVASVPARLEALRTEAATMGARARAEWEAWFADDVLFHRMVDGCLDIARTRQVPERRLRWTALRALAEPAQLADAARYVRTNLRSRLRSARLHR